jgi:hypothetical protein
MLSAWVPATNLTEILLRQPIMIGMPTEGMPDRLFPLSDRGLMHDACPAAIYARWYPPSVISGIIGGVSE